MILKIQPMRDQISHYLTDLKSKQTPESLDQLSKICDQLIALAELNLNLISERDPKKLLQLFSDTARNIIGARYLFLGILDDNGKKEFKYLIASGIEPDLAEKIHFSSINHGIINQILENQSVVKIDHTNQQLHLALPANHPTIHCLLGTPITTTSNHLYGFFYFADKLDHPDFNKADIQITHILAMKIALLYENFEQYNIIQRQVAHLEIEKTKREKSQKTLQLSETLFRQFAENINEVFWRTSPDSNKIIYVSPAYETIWGRKISELYENPFNWIEAIVTEDRSKVKESFFNMVKENKSHIEVEYRILRPDGQIRTIIDRGFLLKNKSNKIVGIIGIATDITPHIKIREALKTSLAEKETMLKEIHHRVKNNLQIISSLLHLQAKSIPDIFYQKFFLESASRIKSMTLAHEMLYQSGDLSLIAMGPYVETLAHHLLEIYNINTYLIKLSIEVGSVQF